MNAFRRGGPEALKKLLELSRLNDPAGNIPHHFVCDGRIKTIYVTAEQRQALADGTLAIVVLDRYHLVPLAVAQRIQSLGKWITVVTTDDCSARDDVPDHLIW